MTYNEMNPLASYIFECCCGERFNNVRAASVCKKCRSYSVWGYTKYVVNVKTDEVVYGTMPSDEEYKSQEALAEERWAEEQAEWQQQRDEEDSRWYLAQEAKAQAAAKVATESAEDRLWAIQDRLMCR